MAMDKKNPLFLVRKRVYL